MAARVTIYDNVVRATSLRIAISTVEKIMLEVEFEAKRITATGPYTTGRLSSSIKRRPVIIRGDIVTGDVGSDLAYAEFVHDGTPPHAIFPRGPYTLRFYWRKVGHVVRPWMVHHPGQKAKPFLVGPLVRISARHGWVVYTRRMGVLG
jgi:hypothetical protein